MSRSWQGVFPAVTTKFTADDKLDIKEMERCFKLQLDAGVDGLIVCGSLGESSTLEMDEKIEILKTAIRVAGGKKPVMLSVMEGSTRRAHCIISGCPCLKDCLPLPARLA